MTIEVHEGVIVVDGEPRVLVSADYPYYRDDPARWPDRLRALRDDLGIEVVTCYIPWRHHQPEADTPPDFTGHTAPGRDVVGFLGLCHRLGLKVVAKPGPFVHAELTYGGLPDWVCPERNPAIEPVLDASGEPARWADSPARAPGRPLPAPLAEPFATLAGEWLAAVGAKVLDAAAHPNGPVILTQIANEGVYTDGARPLTAYDYSPSALALHRERTGRAEPPRTGREDTATLTGWGRFHAAYLAEVYRRWAEAVNGRVPVVVNLNPPTVEALDDWLARVCPPLWGGIAYGFTNWMGVVSADPDAWFRYVVAAKLAPGPNMEENWGFSQLYDRAYQDAATSFHQSLLALAAGATGFNVYTGVSTSGWAASLDSATPSPYPDCAPIAADGSATAKAPAVAALAGFLARHGAEFLTCVPVTGGSFGLYRPYAGLAAWDAGDSVVCGRSLRAFHDRMRAVGHDYRIVDLETGDLAGHPRLTVPGGPFLHRHVQRALAGHIAAGGVVEVDGAVPVLDEDLNPCTVLAAALPPGPPPAPAPPRARVVAGAADVFLRTHPERDVAHLTVLVRDGNEGPVRIDLDGRELEVVAARGGAAVIRLEAGELDDALVKGVNRYLGSEVAASVRLGGRAHAATAPADLYRVGGTLRRIS
ncbi:beta-galactosidase [Nonomuraea sp. SMC257]|uniref:Beta-galactosidase n=1 Tax=Nonomuraea montanisoli TaxID=2741721 RepID=A0A7Y6I9V9_9ACTN|nr:beta-galactosidase [Nonomuraea montanisoli]NUW34334.1 beta-galactosidase [Nonomuraea montanisoli]